MSEQLLLRRGTATQVAAGTPAQGEPWVDTTNNRICIGDGSTAGGWPAAKLAEINQRTAVADAAYAVLTTDRLVAYTSITAARAVTLPAASAYPTGVVLIVVDESGSVSATDSITINRAGSDTINGQNSLSIVVPYGVLSLESNGSNAWTAVDGAGRQLTTVVQSPFGANLQAGILEFAVTGLSGATVTPGTQIPAGAIVLSVGCRVTTTITGATSFSVGVSGTPGEFGSGIGLSAGTTNVGVVNPTAFAAATSLLLTSAGSNFTAGAVRLSIHYLLPNPSTS